MTPPPASLPPDEPPTSALVAGAHRDDPGAFAALYERLAPALFTWASLRVRSSLRHLVDPEDVLQEVWFRACRRFADFDPERSPFRAWIFRIAELVLIEAFRGLRGRPLPGREVFAPDPPLEAVAAEGTAITRRVATDDTLAQVVAKLMALPLEDQKLLIYRGLEALPHEEVARRLEIRPDAARKKWERLRERLVAMKLPEALGESL